MGTIHQMKPAYHFSVFELPLTDNNGHETIHRFLVQKNLDGMIVNFTGYEYFSAPYTGRKPSPKKATKKELYYVSHALNYILIEHRSKYQIDRLCDVTADMLFDAFDAYVCTPKQPLSDEYRSQQSIDKYVFAVSSFFANVSAFCSGCAITPEELFYEKITMSKQGTFSKKHVMQCPIYKTKSKSPEETKLMRDIPEKVLDLLIELAEIHDPMLVFPIITSKTAGLRLGELMNMRQKDSPLSGTPGIQFKYVGSAVSNVEIDLRHEYTMRSDGVSCGKIKKERTVTLYKPFIPEFLRGYEFHMRLLQNISCEPEFKPMFINRNGKAMTGKGFSARFSSLVKRHLKPKLLTSDDPALVAFGTELDYLSLTPHALRHYFSVCLVLENLDTAQIMYYRGDTSPTSALTYLSNKGALIEKLNATHTSVLDILRTED